MAFDRFGLPVTEYGDGGDSCATAGNLIALGKNLDMPIHLYVKGEEPVRHPDSFEWYGRPGRFSRDQLLGLLNGLVVQHPNFQDVKSRLFKMHKKKLFITAWNRIHNWVYDTREEHEKKSNPNVEWDKMPKTPDFTGPEVWALWIRAYRFWPFYPLLWLFDIETLIGGIHWRFFRKDRVTRNHLLVTMTSKKYMPTLISFLNYYMTPRKDLLLRWKGHCETTREINAFEGLEDLP